MSWSIVLNLKTERNRLMDQAVLGWGLNFKEEERLDRINKILAKIRTKSDISLGVQKSKKS